VVPRRAVVALCAFLVLAAAIAAPEVQAAQLLQNGGFESGTLGWRTAGSVAADCAGRTGSGLRLSVTADQSAAVRQDVTGVASGSVPYTLTGFARLGSGGPGAVARLEVFDAAGNSLVGSSAELALGANWAQFNVGVDQAPAGAVALAVRVSASGVQGSVCLDDLALEGPPPVTLTPTPVPTNTPLPTPVPQDTPRPPTATKTPRPPQPTPTPPTATRQPSPTKAAGALSPRAGSAASGPAPIAWEEILNGGFEEGIGPWQKFGGELSLVSAPVHSGSAAAALASTTSSTKWLYQAVKVQEGATYEFGGYVLADFGVQEAYLRVSWYESLDGSGSAISNSDSTARVAGGGAGFAYLTTGPVAAPGGASSARLRVMLAPAGAGAAVLYADDLTFGPSDAAPAEARPPAAEEADQAGGPGGAVDGLRQTRAAVSVAGTQGPLGRPGSAGKGADPLAPERGSQSAGPEALQAPPPGRGPVGVFQVATGLALFAAALLLVHQYLRRQQPRP
jgi:hypothetical protein